MAYYTNPKGCYAKNQTVLVYGHAAMVNHIGLEKNSNKTIYNRKLHNKTICWHITYSVFPTPSPSNTMHIITRHRKQRISQHNKNTTTTQSKWNEHKTNDT